MAWMRFDDKAIDHPKFLALSDGAFRLWFEGGSYCTRHLTDGLISTAALQGFRYATRERVKELVKVRLWDRVSAGFVMHDYQDWNDLKSVILQKKEAAKARTRRWRDASRDAHAWYGSNGLVLSEGVQGEETPKRPNGHVCPHQPPCGTTPDWPEAGQFRCNQRTMLEAGRRAKAQPA